MPNRPVWKGSTSERAKAKNKNRRYGLLNSNSVPDLTEGYQCKGTYVLTREGKGEAKCRAEV